jgi:Tol biopolymer transport system component
MLAGDGPRAVWTGPAVNLLGGPSRDGRWLSFVDGETGDLALRSLSDGRVVRVTANDQSNQFAYFSVIAPKGDQVAFAWFNDEGFYELRLADLPGDDGRPKPARTLYRNAEAGFVQPCAFSPDGSQILTLFFRRDNISQIALVSTKDGAVKTLRSLNWIYPKRMDFSPDGKFIVYDNASSDGAAERDLFVLAADGSRETRLLAGPANDLFPLWSPAGGEILFSSDRGGSPGLWALPLTDGAAAGEPRLVQGDLGRFLLLGMTAQGDVMLGRRRGGVEIRVAPLTDPQKAQHLPAPHETDLFAPALSLDGNRLAFIARVRSENFGQEHRSVVVRTLAGGKDEELHTRMSHVERVSWSPEGGRLLIEGSDHRGRGGVFVYDLASKRVSVVALDPEPGPRGLQAAFADIETVVFARGTDLVEKNLESGEERTLYTAETGGRVVLPAVARGGQGRAFVVAPASGEGGALYAERTGELGRAKLLDLPSGRFTDLAWTPAGDALLVGTEGKNGAQLWKVSAAGDSMIPVPTAPDRLPGVTLDPTGRTFAYAAGKPSEEVWIVEHASEPKLAVGR